MKTATIETYHVYGTASTVGVKLVYWMLVTALNLQAKVEAFQAAAVKYQEHREQVKLGDDTMSIIKFEEFDRLLKAAAAEEQT